MSWIIGIVILLFGLAILFWGFQLFKLWLTIGGFLLGGGIGLSVGDTMLGGDFWPLVMGIAFGFLVAFFAFFLFRAGAILLGFLVGGLLGVTVFSALGMGTPWWAFLVGAIPLTIFAGIFLERFVMIATSLQGANLAVIGALTLAQGHIIPIYDAKPYPLYIYIMMIALAAFGIVFQFRINRDKKLETSRPKS